MKKTVAALAVLASATTAFALVRPGVGQPVQQPQQQTVCMSLHQDQDKSLYAGGCDMTARNKMSSVRLKSNGCAEGQVSITVVGVGIRSCPTYTQL